jgi:hypothetical protein
MLFVHFQVFMRQALLWVAQQLIVQDVVVALKSKNKGETNGK